MSEAHALKEYETGIEAHAISVTYPNGLRAIHDASFAVPRASITALVGVNGAGKSSLFKAVMGLVPISHGRVMVTGLPVQAALKKQRIAYVQQSEEVDWSFPVQVEDVVMMGRYGHMGWRRRAGSADKHAVNDALERMGITHLAQRQIGALSGGQRKRVFLARALAQDSQVILLDEPFTGIDAQTEERIMALLTGLREEGRSLLVSTHNLGSVPEYCDHVALVKGTVIANGPTETTYTPENLQRAFGGALRHFTLAGAHLHNDADARELAILTDDERPVVFYDGLQTKRQPGHDMSADEANNGSET